MRHLLLAVGLMFAISLEASASVSGVQTLVIKSAHRHGVPASLALKVVKVESGFNCTARGRAGELGPLQIKPATARGIGYRGSASGLRSCGAGLEWGMKHLAMAIRAGGVWKHNQGLYAKRKSAMAKAYERAVMRTVIASVADIPTFGKSPFQQISPNR